MRRGVLFLLIALTLCILSSCGGGESATTGTGRATIRVDWPTSTRLVPFASNSIRILVTLGGRGVGEAVLERPAGGGVATATFERLPVGNVAVSAMAYPSAGAGGVPQASAAGTAVIQTGQTASLDLVMASTITHALVTPTTTNLAVGGDISLAPSFRNAQGQIVLVALATQRWGSRNPEVATVDAAGRVVAVAAGTAIIDVTDTESRITGSATITVAGGGGTTSLDPTSGLQPPPFSGQPSATDPTFAAPVSISFGTRADDLTAADFDGDGNLDLLVAAGVNLRIAYGRGDGTFEAPVTILSRTDQLVIVATADMNGDSRLDALATDGLDKIHVVLNLGDRSFAPTRFASLGTKAWDMIVADFNNDGKKDVLAGEGGSMKTFLGDGTGGLISGPTRSLDLTGGFACADMNGDGKLDVVSAWNTSTVGRSGIQVFMGAGDGSFTGGTTYEAGTWSYFYPAISDIERDGKWDVFVHGFHDRCVATFSGQSGGNLSPRTLYSTADPYNGCFVDLNNDGYPDIAVPNAGGNNTFSIFRNLGNGTFTDRRTFPSGGEDTLYLTSGDFNKDGKMDLALSHKDSGTVTIQRNTTL